MWFNDEPIEILHAPAAHTDGDVLVFFRRSDVVVAGDVIHTERYPAFDVPRGGSMRGILDAPEPHHRDHGAALQPAGRHARGAGPRPHPQRGRRRRVPGHDDDHLRPREGWRGRRAHFRSGAWRRTPTLEYDGLYSTPQWTGPDAGRRLSSRSCGASPPLRARPNDAATDGAAIIFLGGSDGADAPCRR